MLFTVEEVLKATGGKLLKSCAEKDFSGAIIDSREAAGGELFFPLQGEKENGHKFVMHALESGALGALIEGEYLSFFSGHKFPPKKNIIVVNDVLQSLQLLAAYYRSKFTLPVIAVTGSNGKTTTKDFIASILARRYNVLKTEGNLNNHIGLPLMLFRLKDTHEVAVLELGMSGFGEIARLTSLCKPHLGIITNIGEAHIGLLGDRESIARAKGELLDTMEEQLGVEAEAILNGDDFFLRRMGERFTGKSFYFGKAENSHLRIKECYLHESGYSFDALLPDGEENSFWIPLPGEHNVYNAAAGISVGLKYSLDLHNINMGLRKPSFSEMRWEKSWLDNRILVINDAYNANPTSVKSALKVLKELGNSGVTVAVLGGMFELGEACREEHLNTGYFLAEVNVDYLITVGELASLIVQGASQRGFPTSRAFSAGDNSEAFKYLCSICDSCSFLYVLVKGSRGMTMEKIVEELKEKYS